MRIRLQDQPTTYLRELHEAIGRELAFRDSLQPSVMESHMHTVWGPSCDPDPMYGCAGCGALYDEPLDTCSRCYDTPRSTHETA